jgi:hypothetical protein
VDTTPSVKPSRAYEGDIARDLARRAALVAPIVILTGGLIRGVDGAVSVTIGLALVALNFLVAAWLITWASRRSLAAVQAVVLGGYLVRLAALLGIVLLLQALPFIDVPPLVITIAFAHLGLLIWESRHVGLSLAAPGLKPAKR